MVIVIIAGGSGTRLWPLSHGNHPKHLLPLTSERSMLQNTYERARLITNDVYVIPEASHAEEVQQQLPELRPEQLIVEPGRRGTAACVVLALTRVGHHHEAREEVVFIHADHHIEDVEGFAAAIRATAAASALKSAIALIGLVPTYPATGFGYIESGPEVGIEQGLPVSLIRSFKEKPTFDVAERFVAAGNYFWNAGFFAAPLWVWAREFQDYAPYYYEALRTLTEITEAEAAEAFYLALESNPIEPTLIEKTPHLVMVPGTFDWADVGSFFDLHKILQGSDGNALAGDVHLIDCEDSMIHGTTKPIIAIGLSGVVIVDTPQGLLVCAKEQSQRVGELSKKLAARKVVTS